MLRNQKKPPRRLTVKRHHISLTIKKLIDEYIFRIDTDADYQREKVWTKADQQLLLDSIVNDIDIPKLYLAEISGGKEYEFECIDGKQRLLTLSAFYKPSGTEGENLRISILNKQYTYKELQQEHRKIAESIDAYRLDFVIYNQAYLTDEFIRTIFKRLQLGIRLNSGELLNARVGAIRDFVFKEIGRDGPFLRNTKLSDRRYSRQFTLAQICLNSFHRHTEDDFSRARLLDLEDFFELNSKIIRNDQNLNRIRKVLGIMDRAFGKRAQSISSRAVAVSAYLFVERLITSRRSSLVKDFVAFYTSLLEAIERDMKLLSEYQRPKNPTVLENFQKHVLQASVEPYAIRRRDQFLEQEFDRYRHRKTVK